MNWQCCKIVLHRKQLEANIAEFYTENIGNKMMEYFGIYTGVQNLINKHKMLILPIVTIQK